MAACLRGILCPDGDIPLIGDSARGFGATGDTLEILDSATAPRDGV